MTRYNNWHSRLETYLRAQTGRVFQYGNFDCGLWTTEAIAAMTGVDIAEEFRGKYSSRESGRALLTGAGGFDGVANKYNLVQALTPLHARRGDLVLVTPGMLGLKALDSRNILVLGDNGIQHLPADAPPLIRAWHI